MAEYTNRTRLKWEDRIILYDNSSAHSWDCLFINPQNQVAAFR